MPRLTASKKTRYISFDMLRPSVDLASCHRWMKNTSHQYCVPSHHLLLIESGRIYVNSKDGKFDAFAGDLVCFRPTDFNEYGNVEPSLLYQIHLHFAPPPRNRLTPWLDDVGPLPIRLPLGDAFDDVRRLFEIVLADL